MKVLKIAELAARGMSCAASRTLFLLVLASCSWFAATPAARAAGVQIIPHRAVYDLRLGGVGTGIPISAIKGRLVLEWSQVCDGFTLNQRIRTETSYREGGITVDDYTVSMWEAVDGKVMRFAISARVNDQLVENYQGRAEKGRDDRQGEVRFDQPEDKRMGLPARVLFPVESSLALIEAAGAGRNFVEYALFDGSGEEGLWHVTDVIGAVREPEAGDGVLQPMKGALSWPVREAFFSYGDKGLLPVYEVGFRLFPNGVVDNLELDYGDFSIKGGLSRLDLLGVPDC